jgi:hypothetical protein
MLDNTEHQYPPHSHIRTQMMVYSNVYILGPAIRISDMGDS